MTKRRRAGVFRNTIVPGIIVVATTVFLISLGIVIYRFFANNAIALLAISGAIITILSLTGIIKFKKLFNKITGVL